MFHFVKTNMRISLYRLSLTSSLFTILILILISNQSFQQNSLASKSEQFYIDLHHRFGSLSDYKLRGSILVTPTTEYRPATAAFVKHLELTEEDLKSLAAASDKDNTYYLKAAYRTKKADKSEKAPKVTQTIVKSCSIYKSNLADFVTINLTPTNDFISVNLFTTNQECIGENPAEPVKKFNTTVLVDSTSFGPAPDTTTYIQRIEEERQRKGKEGKEDNRSFFAKYWVYIVPAIVILMVLGGPEQGAR